MPSCYEICDTSFSSCGLALYKLDCFDLNIYPHASNNVCVMGKMGGIGNADCGAYKDKRTSKP